MLIKLNKALLIKVYVYLPNSLFSPLVSDSSTVMEKHRFINSSILSTPVHVQSSTVGSATSALHAILLRQHSHRSGNQNIGINCSNATQNLTEINLRSLY